MKHALRQVKRERVMPPPQPQITRFVAPPTPVKMEFDEPDKDGILTTWPATAPERLSDIGIWLKAIEDEGESVILQADPDNMQDVTSQVLRFKLVKGYNAIPGIIDLKAGERVILRVIEGKPIGITLAFNWTIADEVGRA